MRGMGRKVPRLAAVLFWAISMAGLSNLSAAEKIIFKPVQLAVLKIDNRPARIWDVYIVKEKKNLILVRLGVRYLLLDTAEKEVYEVAPEAFQRKGDALIWEDKEKIATETPREQKKEESPEQPQKVLKKLLPSEDWVNRDAGTAQIIRVKLSEEGRVIDVQLPIRPDLRTLY